MDEKKPENIEVGSIVVTIYKSQLKLLRIITLDGKLRDVDKTEILSAVSKKPVESYHYKYLYFEEAINYSDYNYRLSKRLFSRKIFGGTSLPK